LLDDRQVVSRSSIIQELCWLLPIHIDSIVGWVGFVPAFAFLVNILGKRVLRGRAPLIFVARLLHNVVGGDQFDRALEVRLKTAAAHLLAAVHALFDHREGWLVARSLNPPQILSLSALALILYVYLRTLVDATRLLCITANFDLVAAQVSVEQLILVAHPVIAVEAVDVATIAESHQIVVVGVLIMPQITLVPTDSTTESLLTGAHRLDTIVVSIIGCMMFPVSDTFLNEIAELLEEVQLHPIGAFIVAAVIYGVALLTVDQVILRFRVLLYAHDGTTP